MQLLLQNIPYMQQNVAHINLKPVPIIVLVQSKTNPNLIVIAIWILLNSDDNTKEENILSQCILLNVECAWVGLADTCTHNEEW